MEPVKIDELGWPDGTDWDCPSPSQDCNDCPHANKPVWCHDENVFMPCQAA